LQTCLKKHDKSGIQIKKIKVDTINKRTLLKTKKDHALTKIVRKKFKSILQLVNLLCTTFHGKWKNMFYLFGGKTSFFQKQLNII